MLPSTAHREKKRAIQQYNEYNCLNALQVFSVVKATSLASKSLTVASSSEQVVMLE